MKMLAGTDLTALLKFDNVFSFMDYCYYNQLTTDNSMTYVKEDGSGCIIAFIDD